MNRRRLVGLGALFLVGTWFGAALEDPPVKYRVVHVKDKVTTEPEVIEVPALIGPCADVLTEADKIYAATLGIDTTSSYLLDSISQAREAVARGDSNELNEIETSLRRHEEKLLGIFDGVAQHQNNYNQAKLDCER